MTTGESVSLSSLKGGEGRGEEVFRVQGRGSFSHVILWHPIPAE